MKRRILSLLLILCVAGALGLFLARFRQLSQPPALAPVETEAPSPSPAPTEAPCLHEYDAEGRCVLCGIRCEHTAFTEGVCDTCGHFCPHEAHDRNSRACTLCGQRQIHRFLAGRCACGAEPEIYDAGLPERFYQPCEHQGTVEDWKYDTYAPAFGVGVTRRLKVYLPYGYDPAKQYNVLILFHGMGDDEGAWMTNEYWIGDQLAQLRYVYDRMIEEEIIEPLIIVAPGLYADVYNGLLETWFTQMAVELRENILPGLAEKYSTYAASSAAEDLIAARDHFALGGLSLGSYYTYYAGMQQDFLYFGSYINLSGSTETYAVCSAVNAPEFIGFPFQLYYSAAGTSDAARADERNCFSYLVENTDRLVEGVNAFHHETEGGHNWLVWSTEIFNSLQLVFQRFGEI